MTFIAGILRQSPDAHKVLGDILHRALPGTQPRLLSISPSLCFAILPNAIVPEDAFDQQPVQSSRFVLTGDIRIDNRSELISLLDLPSTDAAAMPDSTLFLAAWETWGKSALDHVIGGFAAAIWDKQQSELILVRDHPGERPLYYLHTPSTFAFASMPRALRHLSGIDSSIDTSLDDERLLHYLALIPVAPDRSFFKNIINLPPAHIVTLGPDRSLQRKRYWHPMDAPAIHLPTDRDYEEALLEIFDAAVQGRLRTTANIGSQLSGGMDSSSVTATAARLMDPRRLTAFTAVPQPGFADQSPVGRFGDEGPAAARLAALYPNIDHVPVDGSNADLFGVIQHTGQVTETPVLNPMNQLWVNAILDQAKARGINVLLQGTCGNATLSFAGLIGLSDLVSRGRWFSLVQQVRALRSRGHTSWRGAAYWALGNVLPLSLRRFIGLQSSSFDFAYSPVRPDRARSHQLRERAFQEFFSTDKRPADVRRNMYEYYDAGFANGAASLAWGISLRDPTQDKRMFEFCFAIPIEQYLVGGQSRSLVRRTMRDRLPPETLASTVRGLQGADWFLTMGARRAQMSAELDLIARSPMASDLIDIPRLRRLLETWPASGFDQPSVYDSYHLALGRGLSAGNFIRNFEG